jgi:hypothetical protein
MRLTREFNSTMAQKPRSERLPCLFCGQTYASTAKLTAHLDTAHQNWVKVVLERLGLSSPAEYPVPEYRRALAKAFAGGTEPVAPQ